MRLCKKQHWIKQKQWCKRLFYKIQQKSLKKPPLFRGVLPEGFATIKVRQFYTLTGKVDAKMDHTQTNKPGTGAQAPGNVKIDDTAIKRIVGKAIGRVDGVLGVEGKLTDMLKSSDDVTKGLSITSNDNGKTVSIEAKIITEYGKNIPDIVNAITLNVTDALHSMAGIQVEKLNVEVVDTMTQQEYNQKYGKSDDKNQQ